MKTRILIILMFLIAQLGFAQWTKIGNDIDGEAAFDYSANTHHLAISGDGNIVAFSAPDNDTNGMKSGLVRAYRNINNVWTQIGNDLQGQTFDDYFGSSLGLSKSGDLLAISGGGEIKIFKNTNNNWVESDNSIFSQNKKLSGRNLTINADGSVLAVNNETNGEIIIYNSSLSGWVVSKVLSIEDVSSSILKLNESGNTLIIGDRLYNADGTEGGRVLVYEKVNNVWSQKGSSIIGTNNEQTFGSSVDISGDGNIITLGSPHTEVNGKTQAGFVRTYKFENNDWIQIGTDIKGLVEKVSLGRSVSLNKDGSILAVGSDGRGSTGNSRGIAQIFKFENNDWVKIHSTIIGEASKDGFGSSIALNDDGSVVAIGASDNDGNGSNAGHVRVYKNSSAPTSNYTSIPDAEFEQYLVQNNIDSEGTIDGQVLTSDVSNITQLFPKNQNISDLTGIQAFKDLIDLEVDGNNLTAIDLSQNTKLKHLLLGSNQLTNVDLSQNILLNDVSISGNQLTSINVSKNTVLKELFLDGNQLTSLDITKNLELTYLAISDNQITTLDLSKNVKLINLNCSKNNFASLDISKVLDLEVLDISENNFTTIDVSKNLKLKNFAANKNEITELDFSKNVALESMVAWLNKLTVLDIKNGNNTAILDFEAQQNPDLKCINVDDANYSANTTLIWTKDSTATFLETCGEGTYIPNVNFEAYIESLGFGNTIVGDGYVDTNKVAAITTLDISNKSINDLIGIEDFVALRELNASNNDISSLGLHQNVNLEILNLFSNRLTGFYSASLTKLKELHLGANKISAVDISVHPDLTKLWCFDNELTNLDVSKNIKLSVLNSSKNQLSNLDLSSNVNLEVLYTDNNNLTSLDLSTNGKLVQLTVTNNKLNSLNLKNGNNTNINTFFTTGNSGLTCIEVDDATYSESTWNDANANWNAIDAQHTFNVECPKFTSIPDANFEAYLESINVGNGVANDGLVNRDLVDQITNLNIESKSIADLSGIEDFTNLENLNAKNNSLTQVNFSKNTKLKELLLANNKMTNLELSKNLELKTLDIGENQLTFLEVSQLLDLESLSCYKNQLSTINLFSNKKLLAFIANENQLKFVDIRNNSALFWIDVDDNSLEDLTIKNGNNSKITKFSATGNPNLTCIEVDDVNFSTTNWLDKDVTATYSLDCAPANDDCTKAFPLVFGQQTPGDVISGSANNNPSCAVGNVIADVWFSVTVPDTGEFAIQGDTPVGQLKFAVYQSCQSLAPIACGTSISLKNLTVGTTFFLKVWIESTSSKSSISQSGNGLFTIKAEDSSVLSVDSEIDLDSTLMLFPNPASTFVNIQTNNNNFINLIEVYSLIGKKVLSNKINEKAKAIINTSQLTKGMYLVKVYSGKKSFTKKLIIN